MKKSIPTPLRLYLIRHGETEWALSGRHTGRTDISLTANGENEARELGRHLRGIPFAHVLTSPLKRARQTCALVGLDNTPEIEPDLAEWDYGDYEGKRSVDIRKGRPDWDVFRSGCPHGEMPAQISERADRLIARLRILDGNIALFSHGQFGGVLAARWIGLPLAEARHFPLGTASLSIFSYNPDHPEVSVIALWNAASHDIFNTAKESKMSIQLKEENGGKMLAIRVSGKLEKADYEHFVPEFDRLVRQHGKLRVLFDMSAFQGWEASAAWEDFKFGMKHFGDIERLAMVGEKKWQRGMATFCKPFTKAAVRYFDHADAAEARKWLDEA